MLNIVKCPNNGKQGLKIYRKTNQEHLKKIIGINIGTI